MHILLCLEGSFASSADAESFTLSLPLKSVNLSISSSPCTKRDSNVGLPAFNSKLSLVKRFPQAPARMTNRHALRGRSGLCYTKERKKVQVTSFTDPHIVTEDDYGDSSGNRQSEVHRDHDMAFLATSLEVDTVSEAELREKGFTSIRRTKLVCTVGPACCTLEQLETMALAGMNIARLNVSYGTKEWHSHVIHSIRKLNKDKGYNVAILMDMEGNELCMSSREGYFSAETKDKIGIDFGIQEGVDLIAISFNEADDVNLLKTHLSTQQPNKSTRVLAKIDSRQSLINLNDIVLASDGAMLVRGELGAQISLEHVPSLQQKVVHLCRQLNKPVVVSSQLLNSMTEYPTPTRAEVADVSDMVRQQVDMLMLSSESATGRYPEKSLSVLRTVSLQMEASCREEKAYECLQLQQLARCLTDRISEEICRAAVLMANVLNADAIFVYTKQGHMASLVSRNRPRCPIFAFTDSQDVRSYLNVLWGITPFSLDFSEDMENDLDATLILLKARQMIGEGNLIIVVSDLATSTSETQLAQSIQVRTIQ